MGSQHSTNIANTSGARVKVVLTHPNLRTDELWLHHLEGRKIDTTSAYDGVTIEVYDQEAYPSGQASERRTFNSGVGVVIGKCREGNLNIMRAASGDAWAVDPADDLPMPMPVHATKQVDKMPQ